MKFVHRLPAARAAALFVLVGLSTAVLLSACGGGGTAPAASPVAPDASAPPPSAPPSTAAAPQGAGAPMTMPSPHHGGQILMSGSLHAEVVVTADEIEAYFYGPDGQSLSAADVGAGQLHISMADGHRATVPMEAHGEHLTTGPALRSGHAHRPFDAAISVTYGGEPLNFRFTVPAEAAVSGGAPAGGDGHTGHAH